MSDNAPTPQDDADRVCTYKSAYIKTRLNFYCTALDSLEEVGKASAKCKRIFFYPIVFCIWLLTPRCDSTSRNCQAQTNPSTLWFCHSSSFDHSLSASCSWPHKEENDSDKTWSCSLGTWIHQWYLKSYLGSMFYLLELYKHPSFFVRLATSSWKKRLRDCLA